MTTRPLRLAVVGAGIMGTNHARVAAQTPGAELCAVVDRDLDRARAAGRSSGAVAVADLDHLPADVDAAVVAVPTQYHLEAALELIGRGVHLLVEKPLASNVADAERLVAAARSAGVVLAVGHIERFNAAVAALPTMLDRPLHIEASRIGSYSPRIADGVILDLMIHDIDIVASLAGTDATVTTMSGVARSVRSETEDIATVTMSFSTGLTATFNTSRLGQQKVRTVEITQEESTVAADLVRQDVTLHRMSRQEYLSDEGVRYRQSSVLEVPFLEVRGEPLALELRDFVEAIRSQRPPRVDGAAGVRALELAQAASAAVVRVDRGH
jgi:predicted dehydrogenase